MKKIRDAEAGVADLLEQAEADIGAARDAEPRERPLDLGAVLFLLSPASLAGGRELLEAFQGNYGGTSAPR